MWSYFLYKNTLLNENSTIRSAIQCLNDSGLQIILVVNKKFKLVGTITDGDIRRALIKGYGMKTSILKIMNKKPRTEYI